MSRRSTPYDYGDASTDGGLTDGEADDHVPVIVDGAVMSFRAYRRGD